jgi:hypothetical protein
MSAASKIAGLAAAVAGIDDEWDAAAKILAAVVRLFSGAEKRTADDVEALIAQIAANRVPYVGLRERIAQAQQAITHEHGHDMAAAIGAELELAVMARGAGVILSALRAERAKAG